MIQIGKVVHLTGLSIKAIKWYEAKGLVQPTRLDNQYRLYGIEEIRRLNEIKLLRQIGISLEQIQTAGSVSELLEGRLDEVQREIEALRQIEQQIEWMQTGGNQMNVRYETWEQPKVVNGYVSELTAISVVWEKLNPELTTNESYGVCLPKEEAYLAGMTEPVHGKGARQVELSAGRYLVATVEGGIPAIPSTYDQLLALPDVTLRDAVDFERYIHGQEGADDLIEIWLPIQ
ncbi:MerR family transcriptional regulator [Exiguobacterium sp. SH1S21]|uniref:MerR family transcriptional regulator n=1 Tax=Exiguobacterium sp. SH1S21 TaxID=2510953 RepID=UPI00103DAB72|nr:MerR family transcriptional regulator [Exiguobacterium sp. SH1S21]TCI52182.1 MerR family transcriptional regulator [Exiguobacterium sp. SH1S21]